MRRLARAVGAFAVAVAAAIALPAAARAHGGETGLYADPPAVAPGGSLSVRGDLPTTNTVELVVVRPTGTPVPLATVEDPPLGHFEVAVTLPVAVTAGQWWLQARVAGQALAQTSLPVGMPAATGGVDDRAEPLAAAPRTAAPGIGAVRPDIFRAPERRDPSSSWGPWWGYAVGAAGAVALVLWLRRRQAVVSMRGDPEGSSG